METGSTGRHTTLKGTATGELAFIQLSPRPPKFTQHVGTQCKTSRLPALKSQRSELQAASNCGGRFHLNREGATRPASSPGVRAKPRPAHPAPDPRALGDNWKESMLRRHSTLARGVHADRASARQTGPAWSTSGALTATLGRGSCLSHNHTPGV